MKITEMTAPYGNLLEIEKRILSLFNAGDEDFEIAEELGMDREDVADIIDKLDADGFTV